MEKIMTIAEFVARASEFGADDRTPFAEDPWRPDSEVILESTDRTDPIIQDGKVFGYFLEASVIQEITEWLPNEDPAARVARVIEYAKNDA